MPRVQEPPLTRWSPGQLFEPFRVQCRNEDTGTRPGERLSQRAAERFAEAMGCSRVAAKRAHCAPGVVDGCARSCGEARACAPVAVDGQLASCSRGCGNARACAPGVVDGLRAGCGNARAMRTGRRRWLRAELRQCACVAHRSSRVGCSRSCARAAAMRARCAPGVADGLLAFNDLEDCPASAHQERSTHGSQIHSGDEISFESQREKKRASRLFGLDAPGARERSISAERCAAAPLRVGWTAPRRLSDSARDRSRFRSKRLAPRR